MSLNANLIKELREKSGAGIVDCKNALMQNENDMQILQNIYNNMMAYGAMNHCLLFGWRRKFGFFMNFFISIYFFATERGA